MAAVTFILSSILGLSIATTAKLVTDMTAATAIAVYLILSLGLWLVVWIACHAAAERPRDTRRPGLRTGRAVPAGWE